METKLKSPIETVDLQEKDAYNIGQEGVDEDSKESLSGTSKNEFKIIWDNLCHKVDTRPWYIKIKDKIVGSPKSESQSQGIDTELEQISGRRREKTILKNVCGYVKSGELTGILGPSGAGKSTLLHCLFQNRAIGTSGRILVDSGDKKRLRVCFIPQKDYLNEYLTVREDLMFVSKLKSARVSDILTHDRSESSLGSDIVESPTYVRQGEKKCKTSLIDHEANALRVSELLGLNGCLDVPIRNISGGQRKRLSIARELMSKPNILILDEPTTGLDSLTCLKTMQVLVELARQSTHPLAVVVTIHQPARAVFNLIDRTYFLSSRGEVIYHDRPHNIMKTIEKIASRSITTTGDNQAATLIEIASNPEKRDLVKKLITYNREQFLKMHDNDYLKGLMQTKTPNWNLNFYNLNGRNNSPTVNSNGQEQQEQTRTKSKDNSSPVDSYLTPHNRKEYFISYQLRDCLASHSNSLVQSFKHIFILTHRSWLSQIRNSTIIRSRFAFHAALPLIMLMIFGTKSGSPNNCPTIDGSLNLVDMRKNMNENLIKKNVEEMRLSLENIFYYFILMYGFGINIISVTASHYPLTIHMFKKETINGLYSAGPYLIGQTIAEIPFEIFFISVSVILSYSLSGQISSYLEWRMFAIVWIFLLTCYTVHSLGLLFGSIFINDINVAVLIGQVALFPPIMFSGFMIRTTRMPNWMKKLSMFSFYKHALNGVVAARYGYNVCECDPTMFTEDGKLQFEGLSAEVKHTIDYLIPPNGTDGVKASDIFDRLSEKFTKTTAFALNITSCDDFKPYTMKSFGVEDSHLYTAVLALLTIIIVLKLITFLIVRMAPYRID